MSLIYLETLYKMLSNRVSFGIKNDPIKWKFLLIFGLKKQLSFNTKKTYFKRQKLSGF